MKRDDILDAIGNVDDACVKRAKEKKNPIMWKRWSAIAACLCLLIGITISLIGYQNNKSGHDTTNDESLTVASLEYNGCFYEVVDIPEVLERYGLPTEITVDMAGEHLAYLQSDGGTGYECTSSKTDIELYQYALAVCEGVYVLRDGDNWYAVLFCNFDVVDSNTCIELTELYRVYGIETAKDIASIVEVDWNKNDILAQAVTDVQNIAEFYDISIGLVSYGNDDFQMKTFGSVAEENAQSAHTAFADDNRVLRIETAEGLYFFISIYPSYNWIYGGGTMTYYQIDARMSEWLEKNLD